MEATFLDIYLSSALLLWLEFIHFFIDIIPLKFIPFLYDTLKQYCLKAQENYAWLFTLTYTHVY